VRGQQDKSAISSSSGPWRISVLKELWPEFAESIPTDGVIGTVTRWVRRYDCIRVDWTDGTGTHDIDDLLDHGLQSEEGERADGRRARGGRDVIGGRERRGGRVKPAAAQVCANQSGVTWTY
jgi:hypothetical protein